MGSRKYTIALPVRNGGSYLRDCVASILAQTQPNFDLLVLENGSTDGTAEWLASLDDSRIKVFPSDRPLTIEENWARVVTLPKGVYLTMIGHDDLLDPTFLATIDALTEANPDASLYQTHFRLIDGSGEWIRNCQPIAERETAAEFLAVRLQKKRDSFGTGYVMRSADYERVGGIQPFSRLLFADDALFISLMLPAWKAASPEIRFSYRMHGQSTSGGASNKDLVIAAGAYATFMATVRNTDAAVDAVIRDLGATYFQPLLESALWEEFIRCSEAGDAVPESYLALLERVAAFFMPSIPFRRQVRLPYRLLERVPQGTLRKLASRAVFGLRRQSRAAYLREGI